MVEEEAILAGQAETRRLYRRRISGMDIVAYIIVTLFAIATVYPFLNVAAASLMSNAAYVMRPWTVIPRDITTAGYRIVLTHPLVGSAYRNTLIVTAVGTAVASGHASGVHTSAQALTQPCSSSGPRTCWPARNASRCFWASGPSTLPLMRPRARPSRTRDSRLAQPRQAASAATNTYHRMKPLFYLP